MADNGAGVKRGGIPDWQKPSAPSSEASSTPTSAQTPSPETQSSTPRSDLVEQGKRFLQDESIKEATLEQKTRFLETKGLGKADIEKAIAHTQPPTSTSSQKAPAQPSQPAPTMQPRDIPPIITYPEFLMHSQRPPPIITVKRLVNTAYFASAVGAAFYVASKFLIVPMTADLTEARHVFATHTQDKLGELNSKLGDIVSAAPRQALSKNQMEDDAASVDSDPTELYHRDYGTQTSPKLVAEDKVDDLSSDEVDWAEKLDATDLHTSKIDSITINCQSLMQEDMLVSSEDEATLAAIRELHDYLESLAYPVYSSVGVYGGTNGTGFGPNKDAKDDELAKFKAEIRSVKGTLLSARNFPSSVRRAGMRDHVATPSG